ncbi:ABC transporter ATP-binding protein [Cerasicoccus fimbriatus]|uniref:ABC transporter ATP-binding protein n=1 Tax=Cerasicoccus fimbriatus TaxID=3014554 RepID=UPI0022B472B5|nr:ABC transporter ATP-binding protein [Cerasicoccus sp. TK19100]
MPDMNQTNAGAPVLEAIDVHKSYHGAHGSLEILKGVNFQIGAGESLAIVGPSGCGKTTLLGLCAGLDNPTTGDINLMGVPWGSLSEDGRARLRNEHVGFVFQNFQLIPTLTARENVLAPLELRGERGVDKLALQWLEKVGLADREDHYPIQLSGGEQQRVALARAFINDPKVLFADEPTGNLDPETGERIEELLFELNRDHGATLVLVTHDLDLANRCQRRLAVRDGRIVQL